ncbi:MAG TPA: VOC family protein [Anaerolineales bacterium]|nr:VOC family protein [Anaerolineales bacterium]
MKIVLTSVFVKDQEKALQFYTKVLGFEKRKDLPAGEFRFLTVGSPENPNGPELLLEPNDNPAAKAFQKAVYEQGIPATSFGVDDLQAEYQRLKGLGVKFTMEPAQLGPVTMAVFDDTCGNLIQIAQEN